MKYILILFNFCLFADYYGGSPGANFNYGTNAREISLSNAIVSSYNRGFVAFNNPALLPKISNNEYGFSYFPMSLDRSIQSISISRPLPPSAGVSLSYYRLGTNNIIQTNPDFGTEYGNLNYSQGFGMLSFGIDLGLLSAGFNFKAFFNDMDIYKSESTLGFDFGFLYEISKNINLGLKIKNLSSSFNWEIDYLDSNQPEVYEEEIPLNYIFGFSYYIPEKLLFSTQIDYFPIKENLINDIFYNRYKIGVEYYLVSDSFDFPLFLRAGFNSIESNLGYTLGFGVPFKINESLILNIDYALDPGLVDEGISHLFSFSLLNY